MAVQVEVSTVITVKNQKWIDIVIIVLHASAQSAAGALGRDKDKQPLALPVP